MAATLLFAMKEATQKENTMNKIKVLALFGKSGAGKDTIQNWIVSNIANTKGIVSCTTRPPRDYEIDGIHYHFLSNEQFAEKVLDGSMLEAASFNGWFYGTAINELDADKVNVGVFNIKGVERLLEDSRVDVFVLHISAFDKTRLIRNLNREEYPNCAEICRRYFTDEDDFRNIEFEYDEYLNEDMEDNNGDFSAVLEIESVAEFLNQK